jgi:hypothetical protein
LPVNSSISENLNGTVTFSTQVFDEGNDFNGAFFATPQAGIYHFDVSVKWGTSAASNYVQTMLLKCDAAGSNCVIVASSKLTNEFAPQQTFGVNLKLVPGDLIKVGIFQTNSGGTFRTYEGVDANGNIPTFFSGQLVR